MSNVPTRLIFGREIINLADDYDFIVCNADTKTCGLENFSKSYPNREVSFGIAEQNLMNGAAGIASYGHKAIVSTYAVFATMRACEQVRTNICEPKHDVMIIGTHGGLLTSSEGASHTAVEDISIMRSLPNLTIIEATDGISAKALAKEALEFKGPLYVRLHFLPVPDVHNENYTVKIGKANTFLEYGHDVVFFVAGILLGKVKEAADKLKEQGIKVTIVEFTTIKPIDKDMIIKYAKLCKAAITVEDHTILGGFGSAVTEVLSEEYPIYVKRMGIQDMYGQSGSPKDLYEKHGLTVEDMVENAKNVLKQKEEWSYE